MKKFVSSSNAWYNTGMGAVSISQDELNRVLNNIRKDNDEREKIPDSPGIALSQSELEKLFGSSQSLAPKSDSTASGNSGTSSVTEKETELQSDAERDAAREAKIAERKARAAAILAQGIKPVFMEHYGRNTSAGKTVSRREHGDLLVPDKVEFVVLFVKNAVEIAVDQVFDRIRLTVGAIPHVQLGMTRQN